MVDCGEDEKDAASNSHDEMDDDAAVIREKAGRLMPLPIMTP